ncbi:MAG: hypothetical protein KDA96_03600 [Planctomycetaceae bacterium]|nr:hypothetical protein [Planctomycetaceae bacterium]
MLKKNQATPRHVLPGTTETPGNPEMTMFSDNGDDPLARFLQNQVKRLLQYRGVSTFCMAAASASAVMLAWNIIVDFYVLRNGVVQSARVTDERSIMELDTWRTEISFEYANAGKGDSLRLPWALFSSDPTSSSVAKIVSSSGLKSCSNPNPTINVRYLPDMPGVFVAEHDIRRIIDRPFFLILSVACILGLVFRRQG